MKKIKDFITFLFFLLFMLFGLFMTVDAQTTYKQDGNTFSSVKTTKTMTPDKAPYTWKDSKGSEEICRKLGREYKAKTKTD